MEYSPITTKDAIDAVLKGEWLEGREIPDLRALIEGIEKRASDSDEEVRLSCDNCRILVCRCNGLKISFPVTFYTTTFITTAHFYEATFTESAVFSQSNFTEDAVFWKATFTNDVVFTETTFTGYSSFSGATFAKDAHFNVATFTKNAVFGNAAFTKDVDFDGATFRMGAYFVDVTFTKGSVPLGDFAGVDFTGANFNRCSLRRDRFVANLDRANLEHTKGLILDSTPIRNARFSPRASDPWSQLRRAYTGPRLVFTLMFLVAFFTPYVLKTFVWVSVNRVQEELRQQIEDVRKEVEALDSNEHPAAGPLTVALESVTDRLLRDNDARWQTKSVWELVLGMDKKWTYWVTAIVLLAYNLVRAVLTWFVSPMRDAEERSGVSPAYRRDTSNPPQPGHGWEVATWPVRRIRRWWGTLTDSYRWLIWPHRVAQVVLFFAVISFCMHAVYWLRLPVTIPAVAG